MEIFLKMKMISQALKSRITTIYPQKIYMVPTVNRVTLEICCSNGNEKTY